jgi:hypothetical protein
MTIYVQIGAGVGDRDPKANFRDDFTEFVKKKKIKDKIILVEANPLNILKLKEYLKNYSNSKIFNIAIIPDNIKKKLAKHLLKNSFVYKGKGFDVNGYDTLFS